MALKSIKVEAATAKPSKSEVLIVAVNNDIPRYNNAVKALKEAEAVVNELEPAIREAGLKQIVKVNVASPLNPIKSVKLENGGQKAMVSMTARYKQANGDVVGEVFEAMGVDVNIYVQETVTATFDCSVFLTKTQATDEEGQSIEVSEFSQGRYDAFAKAIADVASKFSVPSPLNTRKVVLPKPEFDKLRWGKFDADTQLRIQEVLPATVSVKANV